MFIRYNDVISYEIRRRGIPHGRRGYFGLAPLRGQGPFIFILGAIEVPNSHRRDSRASARTNLSRSSCHARGRTRRRTKVRNERGPIRKPFQFRWGISFVCTPVVVIWKMTEKSESKYINVLVLVPWCSVVKLKCEILVSIKTSSQYVLLMCCGLVWFSYLLLKFY